MIVLSGSDPPITFTNDLYPGKEGNFIQQNIVEMKFSIACPATGTLAHVTDSEGKVSRPISS